MRVKFISLLLLILSISTNLFAQERVTTFGIQFKPIIPTEFFNAGKQEIVKSNINFSLQPKTGLSFGMVIRKGAEL